MRKVCPLQKPKMDDTLPESFVVQQKNAEVLRTSTSGGFFTAISKWSIEQEVLYLELPLVRIWN